MPPSTMLMMRVQVLPPDREHERCEIDYAVDAHDIQFEDTPDHRKRAFYHFIVVRLVMKITEISTPWQNTRSHHSQAATKEFQDPHSSAPGAEAAAITCCGWE